MVQDHRAPLFGVEATQGGDQGDVVGCEAG